MITIIRNLFNDAVCAVIKTETTTAQEIEEIIAKVKEEKSDADYYDLLDALPSDCVSLDYEELYM